MVTLVHRCPAFSLTQKRETSMNVGGTMVRTLIRGPTLFLGLLLIGFVSDQLIPLVVATVAGIVVVMFERLTR
jgi:hypothetical protein